MFPELDKKAWGDGPWVDEPDKVQFYDEETGFTCLIVRNHGGALCGYVGVPQTHPLYRKNYSDKVMVENVNDIQFNGNFLELLASTGGHALQNNKISLGMYFRVHGGLTYSATCNEGGKICHVPYKGEPEKVKWFGFDCAHSGDMSPAYNTERFGILINEWSVYRDMKYVRQEVLSLARQIKDFKLFKRERRKRGKDKSMPDTGA